MTKTHDEWFERYRFCQPLGQGGMGIIYLAEDRGNKGAQCVIKQLISRPSNQDEHEEAVRLFTREVNLLRRLDHRGVVRFFDAHITPDDKYFLVMDYVPGKNLEAIVTSFGPFNTEETVKIGIQCCEVLEYLHDRDEPIIYRDLKPSNLMLRPDGQIVFIDFGIARTFMPKQAATRVVTAGYSPPEQYFGRPETRSDLYALGATLGHLLTGQRPKPLSSSSPRLLKHDVLLSMDSLVRRLTAHNTADRPESARQVRYELYQIYQETHPDFEIPIEAVPQSNGAALPGSRATSTADKLHRITNTAIQRLTGAGAQAELVQLNEEDSKDYSVGDLHRLTNNRMPAQNNEKPRPNIWQRLKTWLHINM